MYAYKHKYLLIEWLFFMYFLYLVTSGCRWKMYDPSTPLGSCSQFSSLSCFSHPWLNKTNARAFCSSFGYRYYSTRCWLVRHQMLTTNRWNKILRSHLGYDLSSGAVCRVCDSFPRQRPQTKITCFASSFCDGFISHIRVSAAGTSKWAVFLYYPRYRGLS